jgi:hypothetical protein
MEENNLTQLPEKWFITTTEESNTIVCDFYDKNNNSTTNRDIGNHYCGIITGTNRFSMNGWVKSAIRYTDNYTQITFEQFKMWVLEETPIFKDTYPIY